MVVFVEQTDVRTKLDKIFNVHSQTTEVRFL